jgi:hypothetical protein
MLAKNSVLRIVSVTIAAAAALFPVNVSNKPVVRRASGPACRHPPKVRCPTRPPESKRLPGTDFRRTTELTLSALGEAHARRSDSDLRIALVRHPDFAKKVRTIVVEWGSISEQTTLDRYIRRRGRSRKLSMNR